ncbi:DUF7661 family protein [Pseudoalteromonas byunsanensis]|uniref:DUF7661 domain-containing protein n=1 Tax=Pseudoalteromonas byunsanensis TaxID=327939 RepID=A0A1S1N9P3_9GAMM|nr:hypothetical protein [Pseudoalteromonas byunsanensis]OHU94990.1 hypothetical protein BIW53_13315 [Pseudoalteromonas byunsanensis]
MIAKFNVFGKKVSVMRQEQQWLLFNESDSGIRSRVYDVVIPADLDESELVLYLDDIYHELASEKHPNVIKIN